MATDNGEQHGEMITINNWDRQETYVLKSIDEMKEMLKENQATAQDAIKKLAVIDAKFDQYNGFNEKLDKQAVRITVLEQVTTNVSTRLGWIYGGIALVVSAIVSFIPDLLRLFTQR